MINKSKAILKLKCVRNYIYDYYMSDKRSERLCVHIHTLSLPFDSQTFA